MYKSIYYDWDENQIHLWGDGKHDDEGYKVFDFKRYAYVDDPNGKHTTIDGKSCKKVYNWSETAEKLGLVHESDVNPATRFLIDKYYDTDEVSKDNKVLFIDIEIEKGEKYSTPSQAYNTINAITYRCTGDDKYTCLLLGESEDEKTIDVTFESGETSKVTMLTFTSEKDLLGYFITQYVEFGHNIITGWNADFFDMPYLYHRLKRVFDKTVANSLSPDAGIVKIVEVGHRVKLDIAGISILDYLMLYKEFTYTELSNYRLDTVAKFEMGRGKVEYDGDLDHLYKTDPEKYAFYNIVDVELIISMDKKLKFIDTALGICHKGHCSHSDIIYTSAYLDGAALTYCRRNNLVATKTITESEGKADGAYVQRPIPGLYPWVYDLDLTSLYPMTIISLNISPETKFAKVLNFDEKSYVAGTDGDKEYQIIFFKGKYKDNGTLKCNSKQLRRIIEGKNCSIASNGMMYDMSKRGLLPSILLKWFNERSEYKALREKYGKAGNEAMEIFYDQQQLITKILLNSFYGVLLLNSFRFYDKDNGEATTLTGQSVIHYAADKGDEFYNKKLGTDNKKFCIYTDTDSIFEPITPLFEKKYGSIDEYSDEEILEKSLPLIKEVQDFINKSYDEYALTHHNIKEHRWNLKQELVAKRAFWVGKYYRKEKKFDGVKKRYAQLIVNKEGRNVNFLDIKGLDVVRSNFPTAFRAFMKEVLVDILNDVGKKELNEKVRQFKDNIKEFPFDEIMAPSSVKNVEKYSSGEIGKRLTRTPVHVNAAISYNDMLEMNNVENIPKIWDGEKIVWAYLNSNKYNFNVMALKGFEDPTFIEDFVSDNIDMDKMFRRLLLKKLNNFWHSMKWGDIQLNAAANKFFDF